MYLSEDDLLILYYLQKYGFLTIAQACLILDNERNQQVIGRRLRLMADNRLVGSFGWHRVGFKNVPKVYYLKKKGYDLLLDRDFSFSQLGKLKQRNNPTWSDKTNHRIHLIDLFLALELAVKRIERLELVKVFLEYNRIKEGKTAVSETTDYVADERYEETRIVPDGAFLLRSQKTGASRLYLVEMDMGTEGIAGRLGQNPEARLYERFKRYDQYLLSGRYAKKYAHWGNLNYFVLLFVTLPENRLEHIREKVSDLNSNLHSYYLFKTYKNLMNSFFDGWKSRLAGDRQDYSLLG